jgi:hypothetical protein
MTKILQVSGVLAGFTVYPLVVAAGLVWLVQLAGLDRPVETVASCSDSPYGCPPSLRWAGPASASQRSVPCCGVARTRH